ncbi:MAG: hypothetical protein KDI82_08325 [Gammaproteobacteria bacterium]|nr:hypothetical protein [Gammaproteobacteria bacterium]
MQRFEFADALIEVLQHSYEEELALSSHAQATTDARRAKLLSWRRATQVLLDRLYEARLQLGEGADVLIRVDAQHQVLLFINDVAVAFSTPRPGTEKALENAAISRYCGFNDCSSLAITPGEIAADRPAGTWSLGDRRSPGYELKNRFRCAFRDLSDRGAKQLACEAAGSETSTLVDALRQIADRGHAIDWQRLATERRINGPDVTLFPLGAGNALQLTLPHLARLDRKGWTTLIGQLPAVMRQIDLPVTMEAADLILAP